MAYSDRLLVPGNLKKVTSAMSDTDFNGNPFTIAWVSAVATVVGIPAESGDATVSLIIPAGSNCPVLLKEIVSTTADIFIGY